jgi:methionyl-tRNA formyltransferase
MRTVVFAYSDVGHACLSEILAQRDQVVALFTHADDPGETQWFASVAELARRHGIPVHTPADVNTPESADLVRGLAPEMIFSFYYRKMIAPEILALAPRGAFNMHGSLLPRYRGRAPINWVLVRGEVETGVTLHEMALKPDAGDIVAQRRVVIDFEDTAFTLSHKITAAARALMHETLPLLRAGTAPRTPQDLSTGNYCRGRKPADGLIDWSKDAMAVYNLVRAVTHPFPGAFTFLAGRKVFVWQAHPVAGDAGGALPGTVLRRDPEGRTALVATGTGLLRVEQVQFEGEPETTGDALAPGSRLTSAVEPAH